MTKRGPLLHTDSETALVLSRRAGRPARIGWRLFSADRRIACAVYAAPTPGKLGGFDDRGCLAKIGAARRLTARLIGPERPRWEKDAESRPISQTPPAQSEAAAIKPSLQNLIAAVLLFMQNHHPKVAVLCGICYLRPCSQ